MEQLSQGGVVLQEFQLRRNLFWAYPLRGSSLGLPWPLNPKIELVSLELTDSAVMVLRLGDKFCEHNTILFSCAANRNCHQERKTCHIGS